MGAGDDNKDHYHEFFYTKKGLKVPKKMRKIYTVILVPVQDLAASFIDSGQNKTTKYPIRTWETTFVMMTNSNSLALSAKTLNILKNTVH